MGVRLQAAWAMAPLLILPLAGMLGADGALAWSWAGLLAPAMASLCVARTRGSQGPQGPALETWPVYVLGLTLLGGALLWAQPALPRVGGALGAVFGLACLGWGLGVWARDQRAGEALALGLLMLSAGLALVPGMGGIWGPAPFEPRVASRLLACSPATLVVEAGGLDWLRHGAIYDPVGGDSLGPDLYRPWGSLAGGLPGVVGFGAAALWRALRPAPARPQE